MSTTEGIMPTVVVLNTSGKSSMSEPQSEIQMMPCKIDHTGFANVSTYLLRERHDDGHEKSTFRGRFLDGQKLQLPLNYKLYTLKERRNNGSTEIYDVEQVNDEFMVWEYDRVPSASDPIRRAIRYLEVAEYLATD